MSFNVQRISGFAGELNLARRVIVASAIVTMFPEDDVVIQQGGANVLLPDGPPPGMPTLGLQHEIVADGLDCTILGGSHTINGAASLLIPAGSFALVLWDGTEWIATLSSSGSGSNPALLQAAWFVDPANSTGLASNANNGLTDVTPILTYAELARRWGTTSPKLPQTTIVTFLSSQAIGVDEIILAPILLQGALFFLQAVPTLVSSGTLLAVVPKNRAADQLLEADLGPGVTPGMLVFNRTKLSNAWIDTQIAVTSFALTQPLHRAPAPPAPINAPLPEDDTWANGDAFDVLLPASLNLLQFTPTFFNGNGAGDVEFCYLEQIFVPDPVAPGSSYCRTNACVVMSESRCDRFLTCDAVAGDMGIFNNNWLNGSCALVDLQLLAGAVNTSLAFPAAFQNCILDGDVLVHGGINATIYPFQAGFVWADGAVLVTQKFELTPVDYGGDALWGSCSLESTAGGRTTFTQSAALEILCTGGLKLDGATVGMTVDRTLAVPVFAGNVTVTPATLDASPGRAIFNAQTGSGFAQAQP